MQEFERISKDFQREAVGVYGDLPNSTKALISLALVTTLGCPEDIASEIDFALQAGVAPAAIGEAVLQCTPYAGFPKVKKALKAVCDDLAARGMELSLVSNTIAAKDERREKGLAVQYRIFGRETIDVNRNGAATDVKHIQDYLSDYCFGDFYTRGSVALEERELLTFCIIAAMGGCEPQLKAHIAGNLQIGNNRSVLLSALTWSIPYIGFPRSLNALKCIEEMTKE